MAKSKKYNIPKWLKRSFYLVFGLVAIGLGAYLWLQSSSGRGWVGDKIAAALAVESGGASVGEVTGNPLTAFRIHNLVLDDQDGEWLSAKKIDVEWSALSILFGGIELKSVGSNTVALTRFPVTPQKPEDQTGWQLPVLKINRLDIGFETPLGATGAQEMVGYRLTGSNIETNEKRLLATASLKSTGPKGDQVDLDGDWQLGKNSLDLRINISGRPGGVIEGILGLKGAGPIKAVIEGEGLIAGWRGRVEFTLGSGWDLKAALTGQDETTLKAQGQGGYPVSKDQPWTALLGTESGFSGTVKIDNILRPVVDIRVNFPGAEAEVSGQINPPGKRLLDGLGFSASVATVPVLIGAGETLEIRGLEANGQISGTTVEPTISGSFVFQGLESPVLALATSNGEFSVTPGKQRLVFDLEGQGRDLVLPLGGKNIQSPEAGWDLSGVLENATRHLDLEIGNIHFAGFISMFGNHLAFYIMRNGEHKLSVCTPVSVPNYVAANCFVASTFS